MSVTIRDIARESGYAVGTVSRVLNHHPDVSETARQRVMAVVEAHGFTPNSNARHLKQSVSRSIAIIVKGSSNLLFADMVERAQNRMQSRGFDTAVHYLDEDANEVAFAATVAREYKPRGFLFLGGNLDCFRSDFAAIRAPAVLLTNSAQGLDFPNLSSVTTDDTAAARQAMDLLLESGHRRVGILGANFDCAQISYSRYLGCRESFEAHGLSLDESWTEACRYSMAEGYAAAGRILDRTEGLTALFALSDVMAIGAIRCLRDRGLRVPEDISVVGFDGVALGEYCVPRLTTVRQDTRSMVHRAAEILLSRLTEELPPVHETIPFTLIPGESAGPSPI